MNVFVYTTVLVLILFYVGRKPLDKNITIETEKTKIRDTNTLFLLFQFETNGCFSFICSSYILIYLLTREFLLKLLH